LVLAQSLVARRPQALVVCPLDELDLGDELRLDPDDVALAHLRHLRHLMERRLLALERTQLLEQTVDLLVREAGTDVARVDELVAFAHAEDERTERVRAAPLASRVAGDHELLPAVGLDLQPVARAPPRLVARVGPLRDDSLQV